MPKKGHTEEQIVAVLRQVEAGARVEEVCLHPCSKQQRESFSEVWVSHERSLRQQSAKSTKLRPWRRPVWMNA